MQQARESPCVFHLRRDRAGFAALGGSLIFVCVASGLQARCLLRRGVNEISNYIKPFLVECFAWFASAARS